MKALRRDLFVNPLSPGELNQISAVVFDPPAAGAKRQSEALAQSRVAKVVAPDDPLLARTARLLFLHGILFATGIALGNMGATAATA